MADEPEVCAHLGLGNGEAIVGLVYLGWPEEREREPEPSARPEPAALTRWDGWEGLVAPVETNRDARSRGR